VPSLLLIATRLRLLVRPRRLGGAFQPGVHKARVVEGGKLEGPPRSVRHRAGGQDQRHGFARVAHASAVVAVVAATNIPDAQESSLAVEPVAATHGRKGGLVVRKAKSSRPACEALPLVLPLFFERDAVVGLDLELAQLTVAEGKELFDGHSAVRGIVPGVTIEGPPFLILFHGQFYLSTKVTSNQTIESSHRVQQAITRSFFLRIVTSRSASVARAVATCLWIFFAKSLASIDLIAVSICSSSVRARFLRHRVTALLVRVNEPRGIHRQQHEMKTSNEKPPQTAKPKFSAGLLSTPIFSVFFIVPFALCIRTFGIRFAQWFSTKKLEEVKNIYITF
jgi:hypothetical protein